MPEARILKLMTLQEVAVYLHIHENTVRNWAHTGRLIAYRVSTRGDLRFNLADVEKYLHAKRVKAN